MGASERDAEDLLAGNRDAIQEAVVAVVAEATGRPAEEITDDLDLFALGLDSLDLSAALVELEDRLDADIPVSVIDELFEADHVALQTLVAALSRALPEDLVLDG